MALTNEQNIVQFPRPLGRVIDKIALARQSNVDFLPDGRGGRTLRTTPLIESPEIGWRQMFHKAAMIYLTNPLCYAAQSIINDAVADAPLIVSKQQGAVWVRDENNSLANFLEQPNDSMDAEEFLRAAVTHMHIFGSVTAIMFQKGDVLPNGKYNTRDNCFDIIYPGRLVEDRVASRTGSVWYYLPYGYEEPIELNPDNIFRDVLYNPIAHTIGVSLPLSPLDKIFKIHELYVNELERFFVGKARPDYLLTRVIDQNKDSIGATLEDIDIEEAVTKVYSTLNSRGGGGWLGLRGDWKAERLGSPLPDLMNKDLLQYLESMIAGVYKIPSSLFWVGLSNSNGRANRANDSIDFYVSKIRPLFRRLEKRLGKYLIPKFLGNTKTKFRLEFDVSEMPLAQYVRNADFRMYERWFQAQIIKRGRMLTFLNESLEGYTQEELDSFYSGSAGMSLGEGEQSVEENNGRQESNADNNTPTEA